MLLAHSKEIHADGTMVEIVIWELPEPLPPSQHRFKYRLFFGRPGTTWIRYDNERGKGDHRHVRGEEHAYDFVSIEQLLEDFEADIQRRGGT